MSEKPNCMKCQWRRPVPGDTHSACVHPIWSNNNVTGHQIGIKGGWFLFPFNFDPRWLLTCDGFEPKEDKP